MRKFGLLGYPLSHTFSPRYFAEKFAKEKITDAEYTTFEEADLYYFMAQAKLMQDLVGFNVTIPYKEGILITLDSISDEASYIGAVNTVKKVGDKFYGYNTDAYGFRESLTPLLQPHHKRALILGTGGAAKAVKYVLDTLGIPSLLISRHIQRGHLIYEQVNEGILGNYQLIINTTPLGMYPNLEQAPAIPYEYLSSSHICYDLIYNPEMTTFLATAEAQGAIIKNGLEMLHLQAEKSWQIWNDVKLG